MTEEFIRFRRDRDYLGGGDLAWRYMQAWRDVDFMVRLRLNARQSEARLKARALLDAAQPAPGLDVLNVIVRHGWAVVDETTGLPVSEPALLAALRDAP